MLTKLFAWYREQHPWKKLAFAVTLLSFMILFGASMNLMLSFRAKPVPVAGFTTIVRPDQLEKMEKRISSLEVEIGSLHTVIEEAKNKSPQSLAIKSVEEDVKRVSKELSSIKEALGSDVERTLSVPLLRKDLQRIEDQLIQQSQLTAKQIDRIYDQNKWFLGLMGTMALGLLGLAVSNFFKGKKESAQEDWE